MKTGASSTNCRVCTRRGVLRLAGLAAVSAATASLYGCGPTSEDEQNVRDSVDSQLNQLTTLSGSELLGERAADVEKLKVCCDDFVRALFDGAGWTVDEVGFEGSIATAKVSLTCRSFSKVLDALKEAYTAQALEDGGYPDESELYGTAGKSLLECIRAASLDKRLVDVTLTKNDGSWIVDENGNHALISALMGF
ncbi:hypothetical protein [Paratractidigestivibacter sp.]|uniref:hypothetical protein n=1 Tax=Paratractidigestivibacter sp. TaxID=2847316 RepID=UPI002AC92052|nr:hypothetical protein [Paratractidigestivibacter sp.]